MDDLDAFADYLDRAAQHECAADTAASLVEQAREAAAAFRGARGAAPVSAPAPAPARELTP